MTKTLSGCVRLLWGFLLIPVVALTQPIPPTINTTLTGRITDQRTGEPLIGATVLIKGTTNGGTADTNGQFTLKTGQRLPFSLIISFIGYQSKEIIAEGSPINIELAADSKQLSEVVVIGYGTVRKTDLTGSVSSINTEQINKTINSSLDQALAGRAAGVQVTQTSGQPGSAVSIRIRGGNSITGGNEPLYVIDGFPVYNNNTDANSGVVSGPSTNALASLNPSDIESMEVLKDASATAIYGSRGANGVVLITTQAKTA